jgi:hypothetical protein
MKMISDSSIPQLEKLGDFVGWRKKKAKKKTDKPRKSAGPQLKVSYYSRNVRRPCVQGTAYHEEGDLFFANTRPPGYRAAQPTAPKT